MIGMDHRYRKLLALAETGSFSLAAKKMQVSQPAISLAIASLERDFGIKLYIRKRQPIELTQKGQIVAETSKRITIEIEKMQAKLGKSSFPGQYQIGIIDSIARLLYNSSPKDGVLSNFEVMVDNSKHIINELRTEKIDLGIITGQPNALGKDFSVQELHNEKFIFVCAPKLAHKKTEVQIGDWLAFNQDSTSYKHFVKLFKMVNLSVTPMFYSTSMEILKEMAIAGKGTALLPRHIVQNSIEGNTLAEVRTKPLHRPIWVVMRKNNNSNKMVQNLLLHLNALLESL